MSVSNGNFIQTPVSISDVSSVLGNSSTDLGTLCLAVPNEKMFSKYKPINVSGIMPDSSGGSTDAWVQNRYGVAGIGTNSAGSLVSLASSGSYSYDRPTNSSGYRLLDFNKYFHGAPIPFMQANGTSMVIDVINPQWSAFFFYFFMRSGALANRAFDSSTGIGTGSAVLSTMVQYCLPIEDLSFYINGSYYNLMGAEAGVVIFSQSNSSTPVASLFAGSSHVIAANSSADNDMYRINASEVSGLQLNTVYNAVACARKAAGAGYVYMLPYSTSDYPALFNVEFGGLNQYEWSFVGVADTLNGTPVSGSSYSTTTDFNGDIYVTVRIYNRSNKALTIGTDGGTGSSTSAFVLNATVSSSNVTGGTSGSSITPYSPKQTYNKVYPTSDLNIPAGGNGTVKFLVPRIFQPSQSGQSVIIDSGSWVDFAFTLNYQPQGSSTLYPFNQSTVVRVPRITLS